MPARTGLRVRPVANMHHSSAQASVRFQSPFSVRGRKTRVCGRRRVALRQRLHERQKRLFTPGGGTCGPFCRVSRNSCNRATVGERLRKQEKSICWDAFGPRDFERYAPSVADLRLKAGRWGSLCEKEHTFSAGIFENRATAHPASVSKSKIKYFQREFYCCFCIEFDEKRQGQADGTQDTGSMRTRPVGDEEGRGVLRGACAGGGAAGRRSASSGE